jgi:hypothetical protein
VPQLPPRSPAPDHLLPSVSYPPPSLLALR